MGRFARSWEIAKASGRVLRSDKELVVLPLLGFLGTMVVLAAFGAAAWFSLTETVTSTGSTTHDPSGLTYVIGVVGYVLITFIGVFFTAALVGGAHQRLTGGDPTVSSALAAASHRIGPIFGWAVLASTVGLLLSMLRGRGFIGEIVARLLSFAWEVVTFLAVPVIVVEGSGPVAGLKRCGELFRTTWGENLVAQVGFGLVAVVAIVPGLLAAGMIAAVAPIAGIVLGVVWVGATALVLAALNGIYRTALYHYATTGQVPDGFPREAMAGAFTAKAAGGGGFGGGFAGGLGRR
jgi:hypothetical protein